MSEPILHPFPGGMTPPSWVLVASEVDSWLGEVAELEALMPDFPERLASVHRRFEAIHPFSMGMVVRGGSFSI